ncbi:MAG: bifunctional diaminohydroxyphosphoribosylaminopyrimidine deaminase/5-amino-6-(5-phosphoribosylamino)uracil reductase RibD [Longimicrobiales bacterium]
MRHALRLAERGWGSVHPNPLVGAVVVQGSAVVGEGWHEVYGGPHAEVAALNAAAGSTQGATLYVNLEPCNHHGQTPPCTDAIAAAGIARVVFASRDSNPVAAGGSAELERNGITVTPGIEHERARALNAMFFHSQEHTTPFVTLKLALSLDGRIAQRAGAPTRLTGTEATEEVHRLRAGFDAIMVGIGTAIADDPLLTARGRTQPRVPATRIVLDRDLRLPLSAALLRTVADAPVLIVAGQEADEARATALHDAGAVVVRVQSIDSGDLDVEGIMAALWEQDIRSILCEGGGRVASSLMSAAAVHRLTLLYTPVLLGPDAVPAFNLHGPLPLDPARWSAPRVRAHGHDVEVTFDRRFGTDSGD